MQYSQCQSLLIQGVQKQPWIHRTIMIVGASLTVRSNTSLTSRIGLPSLSTRPHPCTRWEDWPVSSSRPLLEHAPRKWASRILLYCQRAQKSLAVVYYHSLPTHDFASWLSCRCWTQDLQRQHYCWEENTILIQITDCWVAAGARETGNEGTTKSNFYRRIGRVC